MRRKLTTIALAGALTLGLALPAEAHPNSCVTHTHRVWWRFWQYIPGPTETWEISSKLPVHGPRYFTVWPSGRPGGTAPRRCW